MIKSVNSQRVIFTPLSLDRLFAGVDQLAEVIRPTLGPVGRTVLVKPLPGKSDLEILEDGGTIARRIYRLQDRDENMGAMILRGCLTTLSDKVGDGTATATVIFQAILRESRKLIVAGVSPVDLRRSLEEAAKKVCELLRSYARPIEGQDEITRCAMAICHDPEMANLLGEAFYLTGGDGYINAKEWHRRNIDREYFEGCYWTGTWVSPYMILDTATNETHLEDVAVFLSDLEITEVDEIVPVLEAALATGKKNLFMVVGGLSGQALAVAIANIKSGAVNTLAVKSDALYSEAPYLIEDVGYLTGSKPFLRVRGDNTRNTTPADLGMSRKAWATSSHFGIIAGGGDPHALRQHTATLRKRLKLETNHEEMRLLRKRLGKLLGGVVTIQVGAATESEMKLRFAVAKRAISTLHLAMDQGVVLGGGSTLVHLAESLRKIPAETPTTWGLNVLANALDEPLGVIAHNAGLPSKAMIANVRKAPPDYGLDARTGELVNLWDAGILDPVAVIEASIQSAARTAALLLSTEVLVHSKQADREFLFNRSTPRRVYEKKGNQS